MSIVRGVCEEEGRGNACKDVIAFNVINIHLMNVKMLISRSSKMSILTALIPYFDSLKSTSLYLGK